MRRLIHLLAAAALAAVAVLPAQAQVLKVNPRIGAYVPLSDLGELSGERISLDNSLAFGLAFELDLPVLPFNLRANLDYASDAAISDGGVDQDAGRTTVLAVAADAVFRSRRAVLVQPYLVLGAGLRQYAFDAADTAGFRDASDPALHLGGGLDLGFRSFSLNAEVGDYISRFELEGDDARIQHDLFLTVGFSVGLF
jgi:hypothetical protein